MDMINHKTNTNYKIIWPMYTCSSNLGIDVDYKFI